MQDWAKTGMAQRVGVLLFAQFSNHCLANTVEPLRAANGHAGRQVYDWRVLTLDGGPVASSSGLSISPHGRLADHAGEMLVVMPSYGFQAHATPVTARALRAAAGRHPVMAGFDTGSWLLAAAGLLQGRRATIHWEELSRFAEAFPDLTALRERFVIDGDRITCGGALTAFDLILDLIGSTHGAALRLDVATLFMSPQATGPATPQARGALTAFDLILDLIGSTHGAALRLDVATLFMSPQATGPAAPQARGALVARALGLMQAHLEQPLTIAALSARLGQPQRAVEARMQAELGATPRAVYRRLRLRLAQKLATDTGLSVAEIALRCGYQNPAALTRALRAEFGQTPRGMRAQLA